MHLPTVRHLLQITALASVCALPARAAWVSADFSTYSDGALVGQNGWAQYNTQSTNPITVSGGSVNFPAGSTTNDQDAFLAFPSQVTQPTEGTTSFYVGLKLSVGGASSSTTYFAALNTLTDGTTSGNFQNARLAAQASGSGYVFGVRVNGQGGYPYAFGSTELSFDTDYTVVLKVDMVAGNANDSIQMFVVPTGDAFDFDTVYATATYNTGSVTDPLFGAFLLTQFANGSNPQQDVTFDSLMVTDSQSEILGFAAIPEPASFAALAGALVLGGAALRRRPRAA